MFKEEHFYENLPIKSVINNTTVFNEDVSYQNISLQSPINC